MDTNAIPGLALTACSVPLFLAGVLYLLLHRNSIDLPFVGPRWAPLWGDPDAEVAYLKEGYAKV